MIAKLIGYRRVDFTDDSGRQVQGYSCFITYPDSQVAGVVAEKVFIGDRIMGVGFVPVLDADIELSYGPRGRLMSVHNAE